MAITITLTVHYAPLVAKPSPPVLSGPTGRALPGHRVSFTCESHGFSPREITLKWFKDGNELPASQTSVDPEGDGASYSISSTARVPLAPGDVRSQVVCEVAHVTLQGGPPLRGTANLSETIRGRCPHTQPAPTPGPNPASLLHPLLFAPGLEWPGISFPAVLPVTGHRDVLLTHVCVMAAARSTPITCRAPCSELSSTFPIATPTTEHLLSARPLCSW